MKNINQHTTIIKKDFEELLERIKKNPLLKEPSSLQKLLRTTAWQRLTSGINFVVIAAIEITLNGSFFYL